jgi:methylenetetrahydrofolate dehydrogenase (NADP+) / methenyltetrahydrofolate cyclohydrolase
VGSSTTLRLEGKPVAERIFEDAARAIARGRGRGWPVPCLASVHRGEATPFQFYLRQQAKAAERLGITFEERPLGPVDAPGLNAALRAIDRDEGIHGVILEHPLPAPFDFAAAVSELRPAKDTDGVNWANLGHLEWGRPVQAPAVALAALRILEHYGYEVAGQRVAVVGRSATVGLPTVLRLLARGPGGDATVTVAHSRTPDLPRALAGAAIVLSCAGTPGLLTRANVPEGSVVIDVGLSSVPDPTRPSGNRAVGDADAVSLEGWASALTPVPGGVGPVTVAQLMSNLVHGWSLLMEAPAR